MNKIEINTTYCEYNSIDDLLTADKNLIMQAKDTAKVAYAPYSNFMVGAAILLENGNIVIGSNQENAAFPSGLCAERVAAFTASTQYPGIAFKTIAITAKSNNFIIDTPVTPCGSCRQVLSEYEHLYKKPIRVLLTGDTGKVISIDKVEDILPLSFKSNDLIK